MTAPIRTFQLLIAPTDSIVEAYNDPRYEAQVLDVDSKDPCEVITVQALSESSIVVPDGYTMLEVLEVVPQDFQVGDVVYMDWFCREWSPGTPPWNLEDGTIRSTSIAGWDREVGNIGWHEPQPIAGTREYLVTLPEGFTVGATGGSITWESKFTTVTVVAVIS